jgi:hypothetical protein
MHDFFEDLRQFAESALGIPEGMQEVLENALRSGDIQAKRLLQERVDLLSTRDREEGANYWELGWFRTLPDNERLAAWVLALELDRERLAQNLQRRFERYAQAQPLFNAFPHLLEQSRKLELIPAGSVQMPREDGSIVCGEQVIRLDPYLKAGLVSLVRSCFPKSPLFLRVDPYHVVAETRLLLTEAILVPADPTWWRTLAIHRGHDKGSQYTLEPPENVRDDMARFWEYRVQGIRRLEVHAHRPKADYLSMMVEELVDLRATDGHVIGRCIHWDTRAPSGTEVSSAIAEHLDLAINVYQGKAAEKRLGQSLADGDKVEDAKPRVHLLRIELIPVQTVLAFVGAFFKSKLLRREWIEDQFRVTSGDVL